MLQQFRGHSADYSITSSAQASSAAGTSRPSALTVLRLIVKAYLIGDCTGSSLGAGSPTSATRGIVVVAALNPRTKWCRSSGSSVCVVVAGRPRRSIGFPFATSRSNLRETASGPLLHGAGPSLREARAGLRRARFLREPLMPRRDRRLPCLQNTELGDLLQTLRAKRPLRDRRRCGRST